MKFKINLVFTVATLLLHSTIFAQDYDRPMTPENKIKLFNGKDLAGWNGDSNTWRVKDGVIIGGNGTDMQAQNEFLCTDQSYQNYELQLEFKVEPYKGFINAGIQFHSKRTVTPPNEMTGFQADIGPDCMGSLYDESRRNKYLINAQQENLNLRKGWNTYKVVCMDSLIVLSINNRQTLSYIETDKSIPLNGKIALQIHGGGVLEVSYRNIAIAPLSKKPTAIK